MSMYMYSLIYRYFVMCGGELKSFFFTIIKLIIVKERSHYPFHFLLSLTIMLLLPPLYVQLPSPCASVSPSLLPLDHRPSPIFIIIIFGFLIISSLWLQLDHLFSSFHFVSSQPARTVAAIDAVSQASTISAATPCCFL